MPNPINWSQVIVTSDLEEYFVDKDTGGPLAAGIVTFYIDRNRTVKKPVYQLTGAPGSYALSALPNPSILSGVGTFQDGLGNNIVPYYFPYQGVPTLTNGVVEQYYITVESALNVPQFTREAWPPDVTQGSLPSDNPSNSNFIPNGQFLTHTNIVSATQPPIVMINGNDEQQIAQGGWTFDRTTGGLSTFNNSFVRISGGVAGLNDFPRYAFNYNCTSFDSSDVTRDLAISWPDVYVFSGGTPPGTQPYTFFFGATSNDTNTYSFDVRLIQNFGTGGSPSPQTDTLIKTVTIGPGYQYQTVPITGFPANSGTLGTNNDDFVRIALRGPNASANVTFTDFELREGTVPLELFTPETNAEVLSQSIAGWVPTPNPDGSDLFCTVQLTPSGMQWNRGEIGTLVDTIDYTQFNGTSLSTITNLMIADASSYITANYSPLGIPYARLQAILWNSTYNLPAAGTGSTFATTYITGGDPAILRLTTNQPGAQTAVADGSPSTGFTFDTILTGISTIAVHAYLDNKSAANLYVIGSVAGAVTSATAGNSGFTVTQLINNASSYQEFYVLVNATPTASHYFTFSTTTTNYYVWFTVDGSGSDPAPGGTGILIPLLSSDTIEDIAALIISGLNGWQGSNITTISAASMTAGANFTFSANSQAYVVWYKIASAGTAPAGSAIKIQVNLTGTETDAQVATATQIAINMYSFAVPNLQGVVLKGATVNTSTTLDNNLSNRYAVLANPFQLIAHGLNTYQPGAVQYLSYNESVSPAVDGGVDGSPNFLYSGGEGSSQPHFCQINTTPAQITGTAGPQTSVLNYAVIKAIKY